MFGEFDGDGIQRMTDGVWVWCDAVVGQFLLIVLLAFPKVPGKVIESFFT